jgi:DNA-binding winged helix-turn-helix (wHTH) protein
MMIDQIWHSWNPKGYESAVKPPVFPASAAVQTERNEWAVKFGCREVCTARREVLVEGELRALQPRPFDLLVYLIENRGRVVPTDELLDRIWKDEIVQPGSLAAAIMRVRKALRESEMDAGQIIRTYQRVGYRFVAALDGHPAPR